VSNFVSDILYGGVGADTLYGGTGSSQLYGGTGADSLVANGYYGTILAGGAGNDTLNGNGYSSYFGDDTFRFTADDIGGADLVQGFYGLGSYGYAADDRIQIAGGVSGPIYLGSGGFTVTGQTEVRFNGALLQVDFDGNGSSDFTIQVSGMTAAGDLFQSNFIG
jgi:Ca2+-binding RTX toxin-like protein